MAEIETTTNIDTQVIELAPSYKIPIFLIAIAIPLGFFSLTAAIILSVFGLFLMFQAVNIKLRFTPTALDVYKAQSLLRHFPYDEWSNWCIYWRSVPILFYFREVNSIHFLPIIFDPKTLVSCLEKYCPKT